MLVLDEADKLLDVGSKETIDQILKILPKQRRTGLFSATQTKGLKDIARAGMRNPVSITVEIANRDSRLVSTFEQSQWPSTVLHTPSSLTNWYIMAEYDQRMTILVNFFNCHSAEKIMVFVSTCACVDYFILVLVAMMKSERSILNSDLKFIGFHGKLSSKVRNSAYSRFVESCSGIMITTDVAARGVDIPSVDWVIQFAAPKDPAFFVHRVGRTARAGRKGNALLLISKDENAYIEFLSGRGIVLSEKYIEILVIQRLQNEILDEMQRLSVRDREILEASSKAFISFLRAYKEHQCTYIFRFDRLSLGSIARCYALLKLPKIYETSFLDGSGDIDFKPMNIDTSTIRYLQKDKERKRQEKIEQYSQYIKNGPRKVRSEYDKMNFLEGNSRKDYLFKDKRNKKKRKVSSSQATLVEWDDIANGEMTTQYAFFICSYHMLTDLRIYFQINRGKHV